MKGIVTMILLCIGLLSCAQSDVVFNVKAVPVNSNAKVYAVTDELPEYPGGEEQLMKFISKTIIYPDLARDNNINGTVVVKLIIDEKGKVSNASIVKSVDPILDNAVLSTIYKLPAFLPGKLNGLAVKTEFFLPVKFALN